MFSFGYKNLYHPKPIEPGPGFYEITQPIGKQTFPKTGTMNISKSEKKLDLLNLRQDLETQGPHFPLSNRPAHHILPMISGGPQLYYLNQSLEKGCIKFDTYAPRKQEFKNTVPGVGQYNTEQIPKQQKTNAPQNSSPFRELSHISSKLGPYLLDAPIEKGRAVSFLKQSRFPISKVETLQDLNIQSQSITDRSAPKYSFPKAASDQKLFSQRIKDQIQMKQPGPGQYNIKIQHSRSTHFSKSKRFNN